ncbi:MAG: hypothetical protein DME97_00125 [Verrucomicrobia bacterium]|nr:MAG: hypothetical protein DME97_00125 [Verrucomicrobiota bacterium]
MPSTDRNFSHRIGEVSGNWRFETHFIAGTRVAKGELPGVQHLTRESPARLPPYNLSPRTERSEEGHV